MNLVIVQARMGSSRLPGKVLREVCGKALLELQYERIQLAKQIERIIIATTTGSPDDEIAEFCQSRTIEFFRGSEDDVMDRYYQAARQFSKPGDAIIRITADCPLIDPTILDQVVSLFWREGVDYASNTLPPTFPDGMDVEIFKFESLEKAWREAKLASEREHVTPYLRNHPEMFSPANYSSPIDLSDLRLTVDEPEDLELIRFIYERLYPIDRGFLLADVLKILDENPEALDVNRRFRRNEGYEKSLREDKVVGVGGHSDDK